LNEILEKNYCISLNRSISPEKKNPMPKKPELTPPKKMRIKEVREGKVEEPKQPMLPFETIK